MRNEELNLVVQEHLNLIAFEPLSSHESAERASKFLLMMAKLADYRKDLEYSLAKNKSLYEAQYAKSIEAAAAKTITEKKALANSNSDFCKIRETSEKIEAAISWTKAYMNIFENAHHIYRIQTRT